MSDEAFKKEFEGQMRMFIKTGDRINFGRMEGLQDAARIFGRDDLVSWIQAKLKRHHTELSAQCA